MVAGRQSAMTATEAFPILPEQLFRREPDPS
jgi:hypothetical protein